MFRCLTAVRPASSVALTRCLPSAAPAIAHTAPMRITAARRSVGSIPAIRLVTNPTPALPLPTLAASRRVQWMGAQTTRTATAQTTRKLNSAIGVVLMRGAYSPTQLKSTIGAAPVVLGSRGFHFGRACTANRRHTAKKPNPVASPPTDSAAPFRLVFRLPWMWVRRSDDATAQPAANVQANRAAATPSASDTVLEVVTRLAECITILSGLGLICFVCLLYFNRPVWSRWKETADTGTSNKEADAAKDPILWLARKSEAESNKLIDQWAGVHFPSELAKGLKDKVNFERRMETQRRIDKIDLTQAVMVAELTQTPASKHA